MDETQVLPAARRPKAGLRGLFLRNINAKVAATPMILTVLIVFVGCTLWTVWFSFTNSKVLPNGSFVGFDQYERLFSTRRWNISVRNIVVYGLMSLTFTMVVGFFLAVMIDQKIRFENTFRTIFLYPFALSGIVTGLIWQWIMNPTLGLQSAVRSWGWADFTFQWITDTNMVIFALVIVGLWHGTGFVMVIMLAGLRSIDGEIWKAARVDGIPTWRTYLQIVLPMMRGTIITTLVIVGSGIVRTYDVVVALTDGGPGIASEVPAKYVVNYMFGGGNLGQALAASTVMLATVAILLIPWAMIEFSPKKSS